MFILENINLWNIQKQQYEITDLAIVDDKPREKMRIDCTTFYGIPPAIDIHVHFREPGLTHKEDYTTGALAAAYGGVGTVLDMPNSIPVTNSYETVLQKKQLAEKQQYVDIRIASAITNDNIEQLENVDIICDAHKVFMSDSFGDLGVTKENIELALTKLENIESTKPIFFHAEDPTILERYKNEKLHHRQRPAEAEVQAIQQVLQWSQDYKKLHFHITHVSSELSLRLLKLSSYDNLTTDSCTRYLFLNKNSPIDEWKKKVNPPLRDEVDNVALKKAFAEGYIDMISSDHSPHTKEEKTTTCPSGMPGVQELLPSVLTLVQSGEIEWQRAMEALTSFPKKLLNVEAGIYEAGNIVIIDPNERYEITEEWVKSKAKWSAYENGHFVGKIKYVFKDAQLIVQNN